MKSLLNRRMGLGIAVLAGAVLLSGVAAHAGHGHRGGGRGRSLLNGFLQGLGGGGHYNGHRGGGGYRGGHSGHYGGRQMGKDWFYQQPKYRWDEEMNRPVPYGYETKPNIGNIVTDGIRMIDRLSNDRHKDRRYYPQPQYYQQPQYYPAQTYVPATPVNPIPQPVATTPAPQKNAMPTVKAKPRANQFELTCTEPSTEDMQSAADEFDQQGIDTAQQVADEQTDAAVKMAEDYADRLGLQGTAKSDFLKLVEKGDIDAVKTMLSGVAFGGDANAEKALFGQMNLANESNTLAELLKDGASPDDVGAQMQVVSNLGSTGLSGSDAKLLQSQMDTLQTTLDARDALNAVLASNAEPVFPDGPTDVICIPSLPADTVCVTPQGQIIQGTGGRGECEITEGTVDDVFGMDVPNADPLADASADAATGNGGIAIVMSPEVQGTINYTLDGKEFQLQPGMAHNLPAGTTYQIEYDRGDNTGLVRYTLKDGTYEFTANEGKGWALHSKSFEVTIDNTQNENAFNYVCNGQQATVAAGQTETHRTKHAAVIVFDRADGKEPARKEVGSGTYVVGIDFDNNRADLFSAAEVEAKAVSAEKIAEMSSKAKAKVRRVASKPRRRSAISRRNSSTRRSSLVTEKSDS